MGRKGNSFFRDLKIKETQYQERVGGCTKAREVKGRSGGLLPSLSVRKQHKTENWKEVGGQEWGCGLQRYSLHSHSHLAKVGRARYLWMGAVRM